MLQSVTIVGASFVTLVDNPVLQTLSVAGSVRMDTLYLSHDPLLTTVTTTATRYGTLVLDQLPMLTSLVGFAAMQTATSVTLSSNSALTHLFVGAKQLASISHLSVRNNSELIDLQGLTGTVVNHLELVGELALWDYSYIASWSPLPQSFIVEDVCCPSKSFFASASEWTVDDFALCQDCVVLSNLSTSIGPNTGGLVVSMLAVGPVEASSLWISFDGGITFVSCPLLTDGSTVICTTDASNHTGVSPLQFQVVPSRPVMLAPETFFTTVNFSTFIGAEWNDSSLFPASSFSDGQIPGLISTNQNLGATAEAILVLSGVLTAVFVVCVLALHLCCRVDVGQQLRLVKCDWYGVLAESGRPNAAGRFLRRRRSAIGGVISIGVVFWMLVLVATVLYVYKTDNLQTEILNLPIDSHRPLASNYQVRLSMLISNVDCQNGFSSIVWSGLEGSATSSFAEQEGRCEWLFDCPACDIPAGTAQLGFTSDNPNAYAVAINWTVSSVDYFGQQSTVRGLTSASSGSLFRGMTTVTVSANPAIYQEMDGTTRQGVLMKFVGIVLGKQATPETFAQPAPPQPFGMMFVIPGVGSAIHVQVLAKQSALALFAQVLAIISGLVNGGSALVVFLQWMHHRAGIGARDHDGEQVDKQPLSSSDSLQVMVEATPASGRARGNVSINNE